MMADPEPTKSSQEEKFEWVEENGKLVKITAANSNGRKCGHCGCDCPCDCECCQWRCCKAESNK